MNPTSSRPAIVRALIILLLAFLASGPTPAESAQPLQPIPALIGHVVNQEAGLLAPPAHDRLESTLERLAQERSIQVVFLIVPNTRPEDIDGYTSRVAQTWLRDRPEASRHVLLVMSLEERQTRLQVGSALRQALPGPVIEQIQQELLGPALEHADYQAGLLLAAQEIGRRLGTRELAEPVDSGREGDVRVLGAVLLLVLLAALLLCFGLGLPGLLFGRTAGALLAGSGAGWLAWSLSDKLWLAALAAVVVSALSFYGGQAARRLALWLLRLPW